MELTGYTAGSTFDDAIREGRAPPPDGHVSPRVPFWAENTIKEWQARMLAKHSTATGEAA
jgi:predicted DNA-binding transcriptional regulator AlpA